MVAIKKHHSISDFTPFNLGFLEHKIISVSGRS